MSSHSRSIKGWDTYTKPYDKDFDIGNHFANGESA